MLVKWLQNSEIVNVLWIEMKRKRKQIKEIRIKVNVMNPSKKNKKHHHFVPWDRNLDNLERSAKKAMFFFVWYVRNDRTEIGRGAQTESIVIMFGWR